MKSRGIIGRHARLNYVNPLSRGSGISRAPRKLPVTLGGPQVSPAAERLVRKRAGYQCEACGSSPKALACVRVVRSSPSGVPEEVWTGPANAVLLCGTCADRVRASDPLMAGRGFKVRDADPRLEPMTITCGDSMVMVWRSVGGRYLYDPPEGASW